MWPFSPSDSDVAKAKQMLVDRQQKGIAVQGSEMTPAHHIALHQLLKEDQAKAGMGGSQSSPLQDEMKRRNYKDPAMSSNRGLGGKMGGN